MMNGGRMTASGSEDTFTREQLEDVLAAFEDRDTVAASEAYAEDGVFIDPHYPDSAYRGPDEVRAALDWALENIVEQPGFTLRNVWEDGKTIAAEVDTHHTMKDGTEAEFPQVFIIESEQGRITRWQSYLPFPPPTDE